MSDNSQSDADGHTTASAYFWKQEARRLKADKRRLEQALAATRRDLTILWGAWNAARDGGDREMILQLSAKAAGICSDDFQLWFAEMLSLDS